MYIWQELMRSSVPIWQPASVPYYNASKVSEMNIHGHGLDSRFVFYGDKVHQRLMALELIFLTFSILTGK